MAELAKKKKKRRKQKRKKTKGSKKTQDKTDGVEDSPGKPNTLQMKHPLDFSVRPILMRKKDQNKTFLSITRSL